MRVVFVFALVVFGRVDAQFWKNPQQFFSSFNWLRQGKTAQEPLTVTEVPTTITTANPTVMSTIFSEGTAAKGVRSTQVGVTATNHVSESRAATGITKRVKTKNTTPVSTVGSTLTKAGNTKRVTSSTWTTVPITTQTVTKPQKSVNVTTVTATVTEATTVQDTTTQEVTGTTEEPRDNHRVHDFYLNKREKPEVKIASNISQNLLPLPAGASAALVKPTKYHYYPHNQHIYLLPECAIQQVCNAVYVRLNWTQPLCACSSRYRDPCSASLNSDDQHTTELMTDRKNKKALTLVKTCEPTTDMRICRAPRDWSLLALQNIRTGKSHYLVICRCPDTSILEGPMSHDQPTYASVPGIRVYGMMCVQSGNIKRRGRPLRLSRSIENPPFPWEKVKELSEHALWD